MELEHGQFGGGSDGNFTGALGLPTLDGLGVKSREGAGRDRRGRRERKGKGRRGDGEDGTARHLVFVWSVVAS